MKRITAVVAALTVWLGGFVAEPAAVSAEEKCLQWRHPGANPNQLRLEESLKLIASSGDEAAKAFAAMRPGVFTLADIRDAIKATDIPEMKRREAAWTVERNRKGKLFLALTALEKMPLPSEVLQTLHIRETRPAPYETVTLRLGDQLGSMTYERGTIVPCVVFAPAPNEPQTLDVHVFKVDTGDEIVEFIHSPICSNVAKRGRTPKQKAMSAEKPKITATSEPKVRLGSSTPPPAILYITTYLWSRTAKPAFKEAKRESRDVGQFLFDSLSQPKYPYYKACTEFTYEFRGVDVAKMRETQLYWEGRKLETAPQGFTPSHPFVDVPVCGRGGLGFQMKIWRSFISPAGSMLVIKPKDPGITARLIYPEPRLGFLATCTGANNTRCGKEWTSPTISELFWGLNFIEERSLRNFRFHFLVDAD